MYEFLIIVAAIVVAQVLVGVVGMAIVFNKGFIKLYIKKFMKMTEVITNEMFEKDEEL